MISTSHRLLLLNIGTPSRLLSISDDGGDVQTLVSDLGVAPDGIAIDPIRRHIFWTYMVSSHNGHDFFVNDGSLHRVDFDGGNHKIIVQEGNTFTPKQMQCDAERGFIYWCGLSPLVNLQICDVAHRRLSSALRERSNASSPTRSLAGPMS